MVQASPVRAGSPTGVIITGPILRVRCVQQAPYRPEQVSLGGLRAGRQRPQPLLVRGLAM